MFMWFWTIFSLGAPRRWQRGKSQSKRTQNDIGFFLYLNCSHSARIRPRSKASLQISASKCGKTLHNTNLPAECPAFLTALHQLTMKDYFKVSQARYTWNAYFGQTNKSIWGRGQRNDCSHRHWLKIHPNSRETSATNSNICSQFFRYILSFTI